MRGMTPLIAFVLLVPLSAQQYEMVHVEAVRAPGDPAQWVRKATLR